MKAPWRVIVSCFIISSFGTFGCFGEADNQTNFQESDIAASVSVCLNTDTGGEVAICGSVVACDFPDAWLSLINDVCSFANTDLSTSDTIECRSGICDCFCEAAWNRAMCLQDAAFLHPGNHVCADSCCNHAYIVEQIGCLPSCGENGAPAKKFEYCSDLVPTPEGFYPFR